MVAQVETLFALLVTRALKNRGDLRWQVTIGAAVESVPSRYAHFEVIFPAYYSKWKKGAAF